MINLTTEILIEFSLLFDAVFDFLQKKSIFWMSMVVVVGSYSTAVYLGTYRYPIKYLLLKTNHAYAIVLTEN